MTGNKFVKKFNVKSSKFLDRKIEKVDKKILRPSIETPKVMAKKLLK